ncbi:MAG TPA: DedA family protein, partial [Verrucomicrobiae bacterium]|nr:DedA family protein [Verrucomicrobiae bacterium]
MSHLAAYLETYGYWVLFAGTLMEGESILIMAGFLAFQGYLALPWVILTSLVGSFLGDQAFFHVGRRYSAPLLRFGQGVSRKLRKALRMIEKYGSAVAFGSRFTYGLRIILPITLGMTRFSPRRFLWLNVASASVWSVVFSIAGYLFGKSASLVVDDVEKYEPYLMLALMGLMVCAWFAHFVHGWWRKRKAMERLRRRRASR